MPKRGGNMRMLAWTMAHHMAVLCCVYADIQYKNAHVDCCRLHQE